MGCHCLLWFCSIADINRTHSIGFFGFLCRRTSHAAKPKWHLILAKWGKVTDHWPQIIHFRTLYFCHSTENKTKPPGQQREELRVLYLSLIVIFPKRNSHPPRGYLPNPGIEPRSPSLQADSLPSELPGKPVVQLTNHMKIIIVYSTPGDSEGQGNLEWCSSWGHKELDTT